MKKQTKKGKEFAAAYGTFIKAGRAYVGSVDVIEDGALSLGARVLFQIISSFSYVEGFCYASNETLGKKLGLERTQVKRYISELKNSSLIDVVMKENNYTNPRTIHVNFRTLCKRYQPK